MSIEFEKPNYNAILPNIVTGEEDNISGRAASVLRQPIRNLQTTIQILDDNGDILDTITGKVISGTISYDATSLIRRTGQLTMVVDENYMPSPKSMMWFGKKFRVYQGVVDMSNYPREAVNFLLGTFWLDTHTLDFNKENRTITLDLSDKMTRWDGVGLETKLKYGVKEKIPITEAIKNIVEDRGETDFGYIAKSLDNEVVPYDYEKQPGTQITDILEDLRDMYMSYICGYDALGRFEIKRVDWQKENEVPDPRWEFDSTRTDRADLTLSFTETYDLKDVKNRIMVVGSTSVKTGFTPQGVIQLNDQNSPYSIGAIGTRTKVITNTDLVNDIQCVSQASFELWKASNLQETATIEVAPVYFLKPNDIISITNPVTKQIAKYEITKMSLDLSVEGTMSIDCRKLYFVKPSYGEWGSPLVNAIKKGINQYGWLSLGEKRIKDCYGISGDGKNTLFVQFDVEGEGGTQASTTAYDTTRNQNLLLDLSDYEHLDFKSMSGDVGRSKADYADRVLAHEMFHAVCNDYYGYFKLVNWPTYWKEGFAELIHGGKERYLSIGGESLDKKREALIERCQNQLNGRWESTSEDYVSAYLIACAIYYLLGANKKGLQDGFQRLADLPNGEAYILWKMLGISGEDGEFQAQKLVMEKIKTMPIWQYLNSDTDVDTCSVGGNHMLNIYGVPLNADDVFNNQEAMTDSIGFKISYVE